MRCHSRDVVRSSKRNRRFSRQPHRKRIGTSSLALLRLEPLEHRLLLAGDLDPAIFTDKLDYAPMETALISGSGFDLGETVELQVLHSDAGLDKTDLIAQFSFSQ